MHDHSSARTGASSGSQCTPETIQAIKVMARTPIYCSGCKIVFEENGGIELYKNGELLDEYAPHDADASVVALHLWRELSTMPETMLEHALGAMEMNGMHAWLQDSAYVSADASADSEHR